MQLKPSINTAVIFFALAVMLVVVAYPFFNLIAKQAIIISNSSIIYTNTTKESIQVGNTTFTVNEPQYYSQQYNILLILYSVLAYPFFDIMVFAMLVGLAFIYWFLREKD
ncbi:hypothetical protein AVU39_gp07 [Sulfolobus monocaudavirus SMV2]|uniref:hypothetical protein n=1 Tax=Sulfolobus monocaudavirus SMV2 TaxID=1580591 RepID=UPI0006D2ECF0|nr:hypothetical protein AVU39_gp07 [Sulfolobus monocaudavirus SMV2]AIZ11341.1 hypothetical protein [Sulfolobus monocaudavirus SMV2]